MSISAQRRHEIIDALRRGTVPSHSLDALATGLERFEDTLDQELQTVKAGGSVLRQFAGSMAVARPSWPDDLLSGLRRSVLRLPRCKSRSQKRPSIAWKPFTDA
jgi:hypothetical protein